MTVYDALYLIAAPLLFPVFLYKYLVRGKYHESFPAMFGRRLPAPPLPDDRKGPRLWVHAVSVGEVVAARAIIVPLKKALPQARIYLSTVTETGQATARRLLGDDVEAIFYYPIDLSWNVRRFFRAWRPDALVLMETEIWPNMLTLAGSHGIPVFTINGRLSDRSFPWYRRFHFLFRRPMASIRLCAVQTATDARRMGALCGPHARVEVTGNCKFDSPDSPLSEDEKAAWRAQCRLSPQRVVVVAGSTHPGEEVIVLDAWEKVRARRPDATLILVPRHPERFGEVAALLRSRGVDHTTLSAPDRDDPSVILLDRMGALSHIYGIAQAAVVCGSFTPIGGHNLLEPAVHAIPVLYGPHMHKQRELLQIMSPENGGVPVTRHDLADRLIELLADPALRRDLGQRARQAVEANRGSAGRCVALLVESLDAARTPQP